MPPKRENMLPVMLNNNQRSYSSENMLNNDQWSNPRENVRLAYSTSTTLSPENTYFHFSTKIQKKLTSVLYNLKKLDLSFWQSVCTDKTATLLQWQCFNCVHASQSVFQALLLIYFVSSTELGTIVTVRRFPSNTHVLMWIVSLILSSTW